jgi:hypothetical protein
MRRSVVLTGAAILAAMVAIVLFVHGTDEEGMRAAIRATARTSALCTALAFARVRVREFSALLPVSHALHYAAIIAAGLVRTPYETAVGVAIFAVMVWNAVRPNAIAIYVLWISFVVGMVRPGALYVGFITLLLCAGIARWVRRPRQTTAEVSAG